MNRKEFEKLLQQGKAVHRSSTYRAVDDEVFLEKEVAKVLDPVRKEIRTIVLELHMYCSYGHVLSEANPVVAKCGFAGCSSTRLCKTPGCVEHCTASSCGIPLCPGHRSKIKDEFFCPRHVFPRYVQLLFGL